MFLIVLDMMYQPFLLAAATDAAVLAAEAAVLDLPVNLRETRLARPGLGGFQLLDLIITELKSHMTCYNSMSLIV